MLGDFNLPGIKWDETRSENVLPNRATSFDCSFYEIFLQVTLTQLVCEPIFTKSNNILDLISASKTEQVVDVAILPPLPKCQHSPVLVDLYIEVNDDSSCVNIYPRNKGNYAVTNEELEPINWETMFEGQTIKQCFRTFLNVTNNLFEL